MATTRSPKYPSIPLGEAIAKAKAIYSKEHMSAMTPQVAAEGMGYNGINGSSLKTISSLKKYGLLEGRGDDVRLTKDAQTLVIDDPNSSDYKAAVSRAALLPEIYAEIRKQFPSVASDRNISVYLEKQGFKPNAAQTVARNYRDSMALVSEIPTAYNLEEDQLEPPMSHASTAEPRGSRAFPSPAPLTPLGAAGLPRVVQDGKLLQISATVDLKGLKKLKLMLDNYEKLLQMFEDEDEGPDDEDKDPLG
jgi:hypothetical protein